MQNILSSSSLPYFSCFRQGGQNKHCISNKICHLVPYLVSHYFFGNRSYSISFINQICWTDYTCLFASQYTLQITDCQNKLFYPKLWEVNNLCKFSQAAGQHATAKPDFSCVATRQWAAKKSW